jgi:hypothetical protein
LQVSPGAQSASTQLVVVRRDVLKEAHARRATGYAELPSLTQQGIWYVQDGALWLMDYLTGEATRITSLPDFGRTDYTYGSTVWPMAVSPDASRVAYACGMNLCLANLDGSGKRVIKAVGIHSITWDRTGARLAAISLDLNNFGPVHLFIIGRQGELQQDVAVAPRDATDPPQWTPAPPDGGTGGQIVFVQTYPMGGRRILTVNADTGQVLDQSREHWDAYFALSPDGRSLLLNNGRGGFWLAPVIRQP